MISIEFEYVFSGLADNDKKVNTSGSMEVGTEFEDDDFVDDGILYAKAYESVMEHVYAYYYEKQGYSEVTEAAITIKNLAV